MSQLLEFIVNHWMLFSALVIIVILLILEETKGSVRGLAKVSPAQATNLINREDGVVVDTRDESSFKTGHIVGSFHLLPGELENKLSKLNKHKSKPLILVCSTGQSSVNVGVKLRKQGFEKLYVLSGGINGWRSASLPLTREK